MSTFQQLSQQIATLKDQIKPVQAEKQTIPFDMTLFSPDEQVQLQALLAEVEPKYHWIETGDYAGKLLLDALTDEDLDKLAHWDDLQAERVIKKTGNH